MGFKPLEGIDLVKWHKQDNYTLAVNLQNALRELTVPDVEGIQVKGFVKQSLIIDANGIITLKPQFTSPIQIGDVFLRISQQGDAVELSQDGVAWVSSSAHQYAMKCTDTPAATAISPAVMHLEDLGAHTWIDFYVRFRLDSDVIYGQHPLYKRFDAYTGTTFEMGLNGDAPVGVGAYVRFGETLYDFPQDISGDLMVGGSYTLRVLFDYSGEWMLGYLDQWHLASLPLPLGDIPIATEELINVGCAGYSILGLAVIKNQRWLDHPRPIWTEMPPLSYNYHNFRADALMPGMITDHALISTYRESLHIQGGKGSLEVV